MILLFTLEKITRLLALPYYETILKEGKASAHAAQCCANIHEKDMQPTPSSASPNADLKNQK